MEKLCSSSLVRQVEVYDAVEVDIEIEKLNLKCAELESKHTRTLNELVETLEKLTLTSRELRELKLQVQTWSNKAARQFCDEDSGYANKCNLEECDDIGCVISQIHAKSLEFKKI